MSKSKKYNNNDVRIKTEEDIKKLRVSGKRLAKVIFETSQLVKPGITTRELDEFAQNMIKSFGDVPAFLNYQPYGASYPFPAALCISVNDEIVHGIPSGRVLKDGDIVKLDGGVKHQGMISDHAISIAVGNIKKEEQDLIDITKRAMMAGIKAAQPGKYVNDISCAIEKEVSQKYAIVKILSGHGVGYEVHEPPFVPNYDDGVRGPKLVAGMVIAIEPMLNMGSDDALLCDDDYTFVTADGKKSAHFEHTILITEKGNEIITSL
jgi:methionyl aminopeptidase